MSRLVNTLSNIGNSSRNVEKDFGDIVPWAETVAQPLIAGCTLVGSA